MSIPVSASQKTAFAAICCVALAAAYAALCVPAHRIWAAMAYAALFVPTLYVTRAMWNRSDRSALIALVMLALAVRLPLVFASPLFSNDAYRYVWDGNLVNRGIDPRSVAPNAAILTDERSSPLWLHIDWRSIPTVYPPLALGLFGLEARVDSQGVAGAKAIALIGDLATVGVLIFALRRLKLPVGRMAFYALHPLVLVSFAQDAHVESLAIAGSCASLVVVGFGRVLGLAAAILTKLYPAVFAPIIFARDFRGGAALAAIVFMAYLPSLAAGHAIGSLGNYVGSQQFNDFLFALFGPVGSATILTLAIVIAARAVRRGWSAPAAALLVAATYLLTTPNALPWYFCILPPLLVCMSVPFHGRAAALTLPLALLTITVGLSYAAPWVVAGGSPVDIGVRFVEYAPVVAGVAIFIRRRALAGSAPNAEQTISVAR